MEADTETIHTIKEVHYREQSDIAIVELHSSVNNCSVSDTNAGKCWKITPVKLPSNNLEIRENQTVYALGKNNPMVKGIPLLNNSKVGVYMDWDWGSWLRLKTSGR